MQLILEAIFVGFLTVIIGIIISFLIKFLFAKEKNSICKDWNKNYIMEITLFLIGFFVHLICEAIGINKWYCKNSYACKSKK